MLSALARKPKAVIARVIDRVILTLLAISKRIFTNMGAGASTPDTPAKPLPATEEEALAAGYSQEQIDAFKAETAATVATEAPTTAAAAKDAPAATAEAATPAAAAEAAVAAPAAEAASAGGVDRSDITRNANGSEEPSSADPELYNVDGTEVDYLVKYKMGGQMWYVQSRMRENPPKGKPVWP